MSGELIEQLFLGTHADAAAAALGDAAVLGIVDVCTAFSTASFLVRPMFFPEAPSAASPSTAR